MKAQEPDPRCRDLIRSPTNKARICTCISRNEGVTPAYVPDTLQRSSIHQLTKAKIRNNPLQDSEGTGH